MFAKPRGSLRVIPPGTKPPCQRPEYRPCHLGQMEKQRVKLGRVEVGSCNSRLDPKHVGVSNSVRRSPSSVTTAAMLFIASQMTLRKSASLKWLAPFVPKLPNPPRPCPTRTTIRFWPRWRISAPSSPPTPCANAPWITLSGRTNIVEGGTGKQRAQCAVEIPAG